MNGFFEALESQSVVVVLAGCAVKIERARLGLHLLSGRLADRFDNAPGSVEMAQAIQGYFEALGLDVSRASPVEILRAFTLLRELNRWQWALAFMKGQPAKGETEPYDYEGRNWAWVIHKLASRYGWTRDHIFNLYPEEAAAYLQEILVSEHQESEERYRLSELAYQYDSNSKTSRYVPYQKPSWMVNNELPKPVKMLRSMLPYGVQNLAGEEIIYH
jgi:hypothetical protein